MRKLLFPILLAVLVALSTALPATAASRGCTASSSWNAAREDLADRVVDLINDHRAELGLRRFTVSRTLTTAATWKARHMATLGYFDHNDPGSPGRDFGARMEDCNAGGSTWGENIAYGQRTARAVVQAWLHSPGHRRNIERAAFSSIGVGVAADDDGLLYWVQDFSGGARAR